MMGKRLSAIELKTLPSGMHADGAGLYPNLLSFDCGKLTRTLELITSSNAEAAVSPSSYLVGNAVQLLRSTLPREKKRVLAFTV